MLLTLAAENIHHASKLVGVAVQALSGAVCIEARAFDAASVIASLIFGIACADCWRLLLTWLVTVNTAWGKGRWWV